MKKTLLYIAGPMRGQDLYNFPAFFKAAIKLREQGYDVINPAERDMADGLNPAIPVDDPDQIPFDIEKILRNDFLQLLRCDAICLLPGWVGSSGARDEHHIARRTGRTVYYWDDATEELEEALYSPSTEIVVGDQPLPTKRVVTPATLWSSLPGIKSLRLSLTDSNQEAATVRVDVVDTATGEMLYDFGNIALENSNHQILLKLDADVEIENETIEIERIL